VQELFDREQAQADELIALRTRLAEVELEATRLQRRWERLQRRPVIRLYQTAKRLLAR
jgi:hypothetical protein